jgi:SAM-dependent methyltransferase
MAAARVMTCPVCGGPTREVVADAFDDRYGFPGKFSVRRCQGCGHAFLDTSFPPERLGELYTRYYPRSTLSLEDYMPRSPVAGFRSWLNGDGRLAYSRVPAGVRVLDIGCGFGETLGYHRARGCVVRGVELDENARRVSEAFGFDIDIGPFDPAKYEPGSFDYVTLDQVLEHVADPLELLRGIATVLRSGGTAIVSTPNVGGWGRCVFGRRWIHWHLPYHQQFFSRRSATAAAGSAGFEVVTAHTLTSSDWLFYQLAHLATLPNPGEPSPFWTTKVGPGGLSRLALAALQPIRISKAFHVVTRVLDGIGVGDNLLLILRKR